MYLAEVLDDLVRLEGEVRADVEDGALLPLAGGEQGLALREQAVHRALGPHQHRPHLRMATLDYYHY